MPDTPKQKALQQAGAQRREARRATLDDLKAKKPKERIRNVVLNEGDEPVSFKLRALSPKNYDKLVAKHPPNTAQRADGQTVNNDTFGPALLSRVIIEPELSENDWIGFWESDEWGRGEIASLFWECSDLCNSGLDPAPFEQG